MKQKTIKTDKATLLVCELPEGAKNVRVEKGYIRYDNESFNGCIPPVVLSEKGKGNWQLLGRLPDITEFQKEKIVGRYFNNYHIQQKLHQEPRNDMFWVRYPNGNDKFFDTKDECYSHAIDMEFKYLIQSNEVYFEYDTYDCSNYFCEGGKIDVGYGEFMLCGACEEAQSKVWDKERTFLFIKVD